ncbi:MAG TPA: ABC transporter ATP-binding protein [Anaeromyxobacteraceae bacterium]|nr:ABC transporter ATP-binding protein [Anaeromyxobacteraceae bacterium]
MQAYLRLLRFVAPYRGRFLGALGCMIVYAVGNSAYMTLIGPFLEFLFTGQTRSVGSLDKFLPSGLGLSGALATADRTQVLALVPLVMVAVALLKGAAAFGQFYLMGMLGQRVVADLRRGLFDHLLTLSPGFYARRHSGDLMSRFSADIAAVESAITNSVASYFRDGLSVVVMLGTCFWLDWKMSLVVFCVIPVTLVPVVRLAQRLKRATQQGQASIGQIAEMVQESISGIRVVQAFGMERWEATRFGEANSRWLGIQRKSFLVRAFSSPLMEVMAVAGLAAAIAWVGPKILSGELPAARIISFLSAVMLLYQPVKQLGRVGQMALQGAAAGERIFEILDTPTAVPDAGTAELPPFREVIRYEGVGFGYGAAPVLHGLDLEIRKGEVVALVGGSGGGKTTVANLLPRFWDVGGGRITIDGKDVREVTLRSLRAQLALVTQDTVLFNDTIRANIAYGRPDIPVEQVERAARMAQAHGFISALPHGYDTLVGEKGTLLSGGQRQRIAIARAFLKDAPILVLDEATSALDAESEREVQRALEQLMGLGGEGHRTTLVIAHRLSTIRNADRIVVLSQGRVVEMGRHEALLAAGGEYARLYRIYEGERREDEPRPAAARAPEPA